MPVKNTKPEKPYATYPLYAHSSGQWAKKIRGQTIYFGRWDDPDGALECYKAHVAQTSSDPVSLKTACNLFLKSKEAQVKRGELEQVSWNELLSTCRMLCKHFGDNTPIVAIDDWEGYHEARSKRRNLTSMGNEIQRVKQIWKYFVRRQLVLSADFPDSFRKAPRKALRRLRRERGKMLFSADEIKWILDESGVHLRAMILLGINCGFGPTDCARLPLTAIQPTYVDFPRPKTETDRMCPLWPETSQAIADSLSRRREPDDDAKHLVFVTHWGRPWLEKDGSAIGHRFATARTWAGVKSDRTFGWLRHTFATIGARAKDQVAVNFMMGHVDQSMAGVYREEIELDRLREVTDHIHVWLYGGTD